MALPIFQRTVTNSVGDIIVGAEIGVFDESTGLAATIFSNRDGTTPLTNPFFTGSDGLAQFYAQQGEYRITASSAAGSVTWRYEPLIGTLDEGAAVLQAGIYAQNAAASAATAIGASNWVGIWSDGGAGVAGTSYTHNGAVWLLEDALADILTSEPSQVNSDWFRINADPMFYYAVSQLAGGDASIVTMIDPSVDASLYTYFVYKPTGQIFTGSVTGAFSSPLDFDPATGIDSGLSGTLEETPALTKLQSVIAFVVSQYASGDSTIVAPISASLPLAAYDWFVDTNTLQVFAKNGATGTFSDPLDFDTTTGTDSGVTGALKITESATQSQIDLINTSRLNFNAYAKFADRKPTGVGGGSSISGSNPRELNTTVENSLAGVTLVENNATFGGRDTITFDGVDTDGKYYIRIRSSVYTTNGSLAVLFNETAGGDVVEIDGVNHYAQASGAVVEASGLFQVSGAKSYAIRTKTGTAVSGTGLGVGVALGSFEEYTKVELWRVS